MIIIAWVGGGRMGVAIIIGRVTGRLGGRRGVVGKARSRKALRTPKRTLQRSVPGPVASARENAEVGPSHGAYTLGSLNERFDNNNRFRGGLVFKAHRLVYHSTLGLRVIKKKKNNNNNNKEGEEATHAWTAATSYANTYNL